jgi:hypothetical protein
MGKAMEKTWNDDKLAFEVWKYYGSVGGGDKDTMIKIVTWLLGFSAAIIGFYATEKSETLLATVLLLVLGISVSFLSAFTALLYGGYATWNWAIADRIAESYKWREQLPSFNPIPRYEAPWTAQLSLWLAKPSTNKIAPVFWVFFYASLVSLIVHVVLLIHVI